MSGAGVVLVAGYLARPAAPAPPATIDERPAPILQEVVNRRDSVSLVRLLQDVASENRRFSARIVPQPRPLERWSDWTEPPAPEGERYGLVVDERRIVAGVGDLPAGAPVDVVLGDGRHLLGTVTAALAAEPLGLVEVDPAEPLRAPTASADPVAPGDAAVATAPGASGPLVVPVFVAGVRDEAVLLTAPVERLDGMAVFSTDGALLGVIASGEAGTRVLSVEAALRPRETAAPPPRAPVGLTLAAAPPPDEGDPFIVVSELAPGGAAARAGLRAGDILLSVDGEAVQTLESAAARLTMDQDVTRVRVRRGRRVLQRRIDRSPPAARP